MKYLKQRRKGIESGTTLLELMITMAILAAVTGGILGQLDTAQQRMSTEQIKVDNFDEARDFVDQFYRDINQIGYPNSRMIDTTSASWSPALANPLINDRRLAVGLVKIDANEIRFEADSNGDGNPESLIYRINGSGACTLCLQRSQIDKVTGTPWDLTVQVPNWGTEVNDIANAQIFTYYDTSGNKITALPVDISTPAGAATIATVKTIQVSLTIRNPAVIDPKTRQPVESSFEGAVSLNNCSMAASGQTMSCQ
jgi:type II secretory pathway pseudopilin PulG